MTSETPSLLSYWYHALRSEYGIALTTPNEHLEKHLYDARAEAKDPDLDCLMIARMRNGEFWIVKKEGKLED